MKNQKTTQTPSFPTLFLSISKSRLRKRPITNGSIGRCSAMTPKKTGSRPNKKWWIVWEKHGDKKLSKEDNYDQNTKKKNTTPQKPKPKTNWPIGSREWINPTLPHLWQPQRLVWGKTLGGQTKERALNAVGVTLKVNFLLKNFRRMFLQIPDQSHPGQGF